MKKLMTTILASMMMLSAPCAIFADEYTEVNADSSINLYANVDSAYTVRFPQKVDVKDKSTSFKVEAKGNISSDKKIAVAFAATAKLKDQSQAQTPRADIDLTISNNTHDFAYSVLENNYKEGVDFTVGVAHTDDIPAGAWSVDLPVTISLAAA